LRALLTTLLLLILSAYYTFIATAGTFGTELFRTEFYDLAAEGFRQGHLYIPVEPHPTLLTAPDPADQSLRRIWFWDAVLYGGKYYIYWGPVPALCLLGFKLITSWAGTIADQWPALFFMLGRLYGGAALILRYERSLSERPPYWAVFLAIMVFGLASPTPFVLARLHVYEASIAAGQCFLFWGWWAALCGLADRRRQLLAFALAGLCWALALGSRATLIVVAPLLVLITAAIAWKRSGYDRARGLRALLALGIPVGLGLFACAAYNYVRFGSPTEFGVNYQLTGRQFVGHNAYILPNIASYLFAELEWSCRFPFVKLPMHRVLWSFIRWPADYDVGAYAFGERVGGLLVTTSWCWLLGVCFWPLARGVTRIVRRGPRAVHVGLSDLSVWLVLCAFAGTLSLAPALRAFMACMRYLEDPAGGLLIAAMVAGFWLLRRSRRSEHKLVAPLARVLFVGLAAHTVIVGVCLGFSGHIDNFRLSNPKLHAQLVEELSFCPTPAAPASAPANAHPR
jgi:hypothetical protein